LPTGFVIANKVKQSGGMMKGCLKAFARKLTDCFVPRNDKVERISKAKITYKKWLNLALLFLKKNLFIFVCITQ
jgi:hypothetical protein